MTFAEEMVAKLETLLLASAGLTSVNVDGQMIAFADLEAKYKYWKSVVAREAASSGRWSTLDLSGGTAE